MEWHQAVKSDAERGPIGAWARHARIAAGYSSAEHAVEAATTAGIHVTVPYLRGIEAGTNRAGRELLARLGTLYGSDPPAEPPRGALSPEVLAEIREAVAEGVALGVARALDATARVEPSPRRRPPPRQ